MTVTSSSTVRWPVYHQQTTNSSDQRPGCIPGMSQTAGWGGGDWHGCIYTLSKLLAINTAFCSAVYSQLYPTLSLTPVTSILYSNNNYSPSQSLPVPLLTLSYPSSHPPPSSMSVSLVLSLLYPSEFSFFLPVAMSAHL